LYIDSPYILFLLLIIAFVLLQVSHLWPNYIDTILVIQVPVLTT